MKNRMLWILTGVMTLSTLAACGSNTKDSRPVAVTREYQVARQNAEEFVKEQYKSSKIQSSTCGNTVARQTESICKVKLNQNPDVNLICSTDPKRKCTEFEYKKKY